jgi:formylglycine-generating enzyme required for sulfatase activity
MVRFDGGTTRPGVFAASARPRPCASLTVAEDAAVLEHPEQVAEVRLEPFDLDELEVTNRELAEWLNAQADTWAATPDGVVNTRRGGAIPLVLAAEECGGGLTLSADGRVHAHPAQLNWPAVCVTWHGASEYCRAQKKRLPLEAEWELAAKGRSGRPFPWGDEMPRQDGVTFDLRDSAVAHPQNVGTSLQDVSPEGVRDLGGSVAEWVEDDRGLEGEKTIRGGSWASRGPCHLLGSGRKHVPAARFARDVGFRCASSVIDGEPARRGPR